MAHEKPINIGFIGLSTGGWGAMAHAPALAHPSLRSSINVSAIQTSSEASSINAKDLHSKTWPGLKAYYGADSTAISNDPDVDVVGISVKVYQHKDYVDKAIAAGKDFFVEYPPGKDLEESLDIQRRVKAKGKIQVLVGLQAQQNATMRQVKKIIDTGKIGKILSTTIISNIPREVRFAQPEVLEEVGEKNKGVTWFDIGGGHQLNAFIYLLGPFASVSGVSSIQYPTTTVISKTGEVVRTFKSTTGDHYSFSGPLVSGAHASIAWRSGYVSTPGRTQFGWIIDGETGSIRFESQLAGATPGSLVNLFTPTTTVNGQPLAEYLEAEGIEYSDPELVLEDNEKGNFVEFVRRSWIEFGKALRGGKGEFATLDDAIEVQRTIDAVERSAAQGGVPIKLN